MALNTHTSGVGSPTECGCPRCRVNVRRSLAYALAHPGSALAVFRLTDAAVAFPDGLPIADVHALMAEIDGFPSGLASVHGVKAAA